MRDPSMTMWSDSIDEFPVAGTDPEKLAALVRFGVLAPSSHNSQPWLFRIVGNTLEVYADFSRRLPVVDPEDRELIISCGAAIGFIEVAMRHFCYGGEVEAIPTRSPSGLLARIKLGAQVPASELDHALFAAIPKRHTYRQPFDSRAIDSPLLDDLESIARDSGTWFSILQAESARESLAEMITEGDQVQLADRAFREELAAWMRSNRSRSKDGMPGYSHGFGNAASALAPLVIRTFDVGNGLAARHRDIAIGSPVLAVLGTDRETQADLINVGRALARLLLHAASHGVCVSFLNQPIEVPSLRQRVVSLLAQTGYPQLILRMGYPRETARKTPRRPVKDVIKHD